MKITINVSARHVHVSKQDLELLFGTGYELTKFKDLYQPNQFASHEKVTIESEHGCFKNVRILGPTREYSQVEISRTDARALKIDPPIRESGDISGSEKIKIIGPQGEVFLDEGCIVANRHIHFSEEEAKMYGVKNGEKIKVKVETEKGGILHNVFCKVSKNYLLEMHIDVDDANAMIIPNGMIGEMILKD